MRTSRLGASLLSTWLLTSPARAEPPYVIPAPPEAMASQEGPAAGSQRVPASLLAYRELQLLQRREAALWEQRGDPRLGGPIAAIAIGVPVTLVFLPLGTAYLIDAHSWGEQDRRQTRIGRGLVTLGAAGLVSLALGAWRVAERRRSWLQADRELRSIGERRGMLERLLAPFGEGASF